MNEWMDVSVVDASSMPLRVQLQRNQQAIFDVQLIIFDILSNPSDFYQRIRIYHL